MPPDKFAPNEISIPPVINTPNELAVYIQDSSDGRMLKGMCRFDSFRGDLSPGAWEVMLGPDVNNLRHMSFTANIADILVKDEHAHPKGKKLTPHERLLLIVTAQTHDLAEAETGDLPAGLKTKLNEHREKLILESKLGEIASHCSPAIAEMLKAVPDVAFPQDPGDASLATVFNAIECVGYLTTALRARRIHELTLGELNSEYRSVTSGMGEQAIKAMQEQMRRLSTEVVGSPYFTRLTEYSKMLPSISRILIDNNQTIERVFQSNPSFSWYSQDSRLAKYPTRERAREPKLRKNRFLEAHSIWQRFKRKQPHIASPNSSSS